jgi:hypothetical protein
MTQTTNENYLTRQEIIDIVTERDGFFCYLCDVVTFSDTERGMEMTLDHVQPLSKGGTWHVDNIKFAHRKCNQEKADREFLEDGVLEPRPVRMGYQQRKQNKQQVLAGFCELCADGRLLMPDEYCPECFRNAVPFPATMKRKPSECSHSGYEWCWMDACGIIDRIPAWQYVLDAENSLDD